MFHLKKFNKSPRKYFKPNTPSDFFTQDDFDDIIDAFQDIIDEYNLGNRYGKYGSNTYTKRLYKSLHDLRCDSEFKESTYVRIEFGIHCENLIRQKTDLKNLIERYEIMGYRAITNTVMDSIEYILIEITKK